MQTSLHGCLVVAFVVLVVGCLPWATSTLAAPQKTETGGSDAPEFKDLPQPSALLVGLAATVSDSGPTHTVIRSIRPTYVTAEGNTIQGKTHGEGWYNAVEVMAKDGYAVGGIIVKDGDCINGFRVLFLRQKGDRLDPKDGYESRWIGGRGGNAETQLGGDGRPVVGIVGRTACSVTSLGLIQNDAMKITEPKAKPTGGLASRENIVYLDESRHYLPTTTSHWFADLLSQELMRQAMLIAARDELGLTTRDARLGDTMPAEGDNAPMEISVPTANSPKMEVLRGFYPRQSVVSRRKLPAFGDHVHYPLILADFERRSRDYFAATLRKQGFKGKRVPARLDANVPKEVTTLLDEWTYIAQFQAVRALHELIRAKGESPQLLGALIRGYANLGLLTELHVHPAHNIFKARALLYAQRAVVREKSSVLSLQHRAYAFAVAGLSGAALADLSTAEKYSTGKPTKPGEKATQAAAPPWAKVIEAYCRYDIPALESAQKQKEIGALAGLLCFRALERSGCQEPTIEKGTELLRSMPHCCRISDGMTRLGGVGLSHQSTVIGILAVRKTLYDRVAGMTGLPPEAALIAEENARSTEGPEAAGNLTADFKTRAKLIAALSAPEWAPAEKDSKQPAATVIDAGEPSYAALGRLIWEQAVSQIWWRMRFESTSWGVSPERFLAASAPLLAQHPYRPIVEVLSWNKNTRKEAVRRLPEVPIADLEGQCSSLLATVNASTPLWCGRFLTAANLHSSHTECGLTSMIGHLASPELPIKGRDLLRVSPHSPYAKILLIENDWDYAEKYAAQWEKDGEQFSGILKSLGSRYSVMRRYKDAERCLRAAVDVMPSYRGFLMLANVYKKQGKMDLWKSTLEEYLNHPDYGLSHANVCSQIADYHMKRGEWKKALPYAEGAAESYSAWGLLSAAICQEGLHHWKEAEAYQKATAERYDGSRITWYLFCKRTGRGDLEAARRLLLATKPSNPEAPSDETTMAMYYLIEKQPEKALAEFEAAFRKVGHPAQGLLVALLCDELKKHDRLVAMLQQLKTRAEQYRQKKPANSLDHSLALAALLAADIEKGGKADIDMTDSAVVAADDAKSAIFFYCLGKYFSLHGKPSKAVECWKRAGGYFPQMSAGVVLALVELRERHIDLTQEESSEKPPVKDPDAAAEAKQPKGDTTPSEKGGASVKKTAPTPKDGSHGK